MATRRVSLRQEPVAWVPPLLSWFAANRRDLPWRRRRTPYRVWVSEVMLQQTRVETAVPYYLRFLRRLPTLASLAAADLQAVLKLWEGLGYYQRARNLHQAARRVMAEHGGRIPADAARFGSLPGAGEYLTAAVLSIAAGLPLAAVDGNVLRVWARRAGLRADIGSAATRRRVRDALQEIIPRDRPGDFNEAMMELGALVCTPRRPSCPECPLASSCRARSLGLTEKIPVRKKARFVPTHRVAVAALVRGDRFFVQQRPEGGHLGGLWEFPGGKAKPGEDLEEALRRELREELNIGTDILAELDTVRHAYSHFAVVLTLFACRPRGRIRCAAPHRWITPGDIPGLPFPKANHRLFPALTGWLEGYWPRGQEQRRSARLAKGGGL